MKVDSEFIITMVMNFESTLIHTVICVDDYEDDGVNEGRFESITSKGLSDSVLIFLYQSDF